MPWNENDYPTSFKNLEPAVRKKAIEIANALLRDNYEEGRAIAIATDKAREYVHPNHSNRTKYVAKAREEDWILMKEKGEKAILVSDTKKDLLTKAKSYVNDKNGILMIYHADGSLEDTLYE